MIRFWDILKGSNPLRYCFREGDDDGGGGDGGGDSGETWHSKLPEDIRADASLIDFKDESEMISMPVNVARSFINTKKLVGRDKIPMPKTEEEWNETYKRLGRPETAALYDLPINETINNETLKAALSDDAAWFRDVAHKIGLSEKQATALFTGYGNRTVESLSRIDTNAENVFREAEIELRTSYGNAFEGKMVLMNRAVEEIGGTEFKELVKGTDIGRHPAFIKAFVKVGEMIAEDLGIDKTTGAISETPEGLQEQVQTLMALPEYFDATNPAHKVTVAKVQKLMQRIHGTKVVEPTDRATFLT